MRRMYARQRVSACLPCPRMARFSVVVQPRSRGQAWLFAGGPCLHGEEGKPLIYVLLQEEIYDEPWCALLMPDVVFLSVATTAPALRA